MYTYRLRKPSPRKPNQRRIALILPPSGVTIVSLINPLVMTLSADYSPTLYLGASTGSIILGASYDASIEEGGEG